MSDRGLLAILRDHERADSCTCGMEDRERAGEQPQHLSWCDLAGDVQVGMSGHTVTIEFDHVSPFPTLRFECGAGDGADCHLICQASACEEGCVDPDVHRSTWEDAGYCNAVEWLSNMDEVEQAILGWTTSVTLPITFEWAGSDIGPEWRFA